jgi:hypothetical protein
MNTSALNTQPPSPHQHQTTETQEDLQQDSEEEIEAVIEDELECLHQENERLRLVQEDMARKNAMAKRSQIIQQQIEQERATQAELQRAIESICQQEHEPSMQEPPPYQHQPQQPPYQRVPHQLWRQTQGSVDSKCPLADNLQLTPWPPQYTIVPPPKYYEESDPRKFLMSYEAMIALSRGDDTSLTKSFTISLENATTNWYTRLPSGSIASWAQLKEKFLVNF